MFEEITENVEIHQSLPDVPNLSTSELKKEWDKGNRIIKEAFNKQVKELIKLQESLKIKIITGQECPLNSYVDNRQLFVKRVDCGNLPVADIVKDVDTGLDMSKINIFKISGTATSNANGVIPINVYFNGFLQVGAIISEKGILRIRSNDDRSTYRAYVNIYYTKKEEV